jgi:type I restriction enzyme S subunit
VVAVSFLPENWLSISVESATTFIIDCLHSTPKFTESGDLCIDTTCIEPFKILYTSARKITKESFIERTSRMSPEKGDILFSREGTIGTAVLYNGEFPICLGQRMMMFRFANYVSSKYAELYMGSFYFKQLYSPFISGTSAQHVNIGDIRPLEFLLPPTEEQKEIVKRVEQLFTFADKLEARYNKAKVMLDKLPQSILAKAFRGELVTQDPNDEPASVLLEKIKQEKEKLKGNKGTKKKK